MTRPVAVVTGAARGIGRATAALLTAEGYDVAAYDVEESGLQGRWTGLLDVTEEGAWRDRLQEVWDDAGRLDLLVNNAGLLVVGPLAGTPLAQQLRLLDVNVKGVLLGCAAAHPHLVATPGSCVVNVSSASALYGQPGMAAYSASKSAVSALTEALDLEWEPQGVRVVDVQPLFVRTGMVETAAPLGSVRALGVHLSPDDVARAVLSAVRESRPWLRGPHRPVGAQARAFAAGRAAPPAVVRRLVARLSR